jgi:hypothetical protein
MHKNIKVQYLYFPILLIFLFLAGCGSGSDGDTSKNGSNPPSFDPDNINQGLTGYLYTSESVANLEPNTKYPVIIDLATGKTHRILEPLLIMHSHYAAPFASFDGTTLAMFGNNQDCRDRRPDYEYNDCIFLARLGQSVEILYPIGTSQPARPSWKGDMLAAYGGLIGGDFSTTALRLISLDGELIQTVGDFQISTFTWLPDGRLMFVWDKRFYLTDVPYDLNATEVHAYNGEEIIRFLSSSHDGTRVAFEIKGVGYSHVMVMNIDGSGLRQLTANSPDDITDPYEGYPVWSPDDQWIMVENNTYWEPTLYAVRSDATEVILDDDQYAPGDAIKIQTDWQDHLNSADYGDPLTAWLSFAPFLDAGAVVQTNPSKTGGLP